MKHTNSGKDANLLWDNASFVLGTGNKGTSSLPASSKPFRPGWANSKTLGYKLCNGFALGYNNSPMPLPLCLSVLVVRKILKKETRCFIFQLQRRHQKGCMSANPFAMHLKPFLRERLQRRCTWKLFGFRQG